MNEITNENRLTKMETKLDHISKTIEEISKELRHHVEWEEHRYIEMDSKYSAKWVEKVALGLLVTGLCGIFIAIFEIILK